jgi:predicted RNA-binding protein
MARACFVPKCIYRVDGGKVVLIDNKEWGQFALTGDDLTEWNADIAEILAYENQQIADGDLVKEDVAATTETINGVTATVVLGQKATFPNLDTDIDDDTWHPTYAKWQSAMAEDENFTYVRWYSVDV